MNSILKHYGQEFFAGAVPNNPTYVIGLSRKIELFKDSVHFQYPSLWVYCNYYERRMGNYRCSTGPLIEWFDN